MFFINSATGNSWPVGWVNNQLQIWLAVLHKRNEKELGKVCTVIFINLSLTTQAYKRYRITSSKLHKSLFSGWAVWNWHVMVCKQKWCHMPVFGNNKKTKEFHLEMHPQFLCRDYKFFLLQFRYFTMDDKSYPNLLHL